MTGHFDVIIIGAGLSGIGAARHLRESCPGRSFLILENRDAIGGTWDLFRYPGVRSDSDMFTLGYCFRPWTEAKSIADGAAILKYVRDTAEEADISSYVRFGHQVRSACWSSERARWTVEAEHGSALAVFTCRFLVSCSGYYDYDAGYTPDFPGASDFAGLVVHPQQWPERLDYEGKQVVVIGSGATAVTLVPELAKKAAHVVMLQRSPTYVVSQPSEDRLAIRLRALLPGKLAYALVRWKNILENIYVYRLSRRQPAKMRAYILDQVRGHLGKVFDIDTHFAPHYAPWDQRMCLVPDADLFRSVSDGSSSVVTEAIDRFTPAGIRLASGRELPADIVVTATGLRMKFAGGISVSVDGQQVAFPDRFTYKGMMFDGVPNFISVFGYTNASWTLKADLTSAYLCRLLNHMDRRDLVACTPTLEARLAPRPFLDLTSGYVTRGEHLLPRQGSEAPWRLHQNYLLDLLALRFGKLEDGVLRFQGARESREPAGTAATLRQTPVSSVVVPAAALTKEPVA